jgi:hypothetical protein
MTCNSDYKQSGQKYNNGRFCAITVQTSVLHQIGKTSVLEGVQPSPLKIVLWL